MKEVLEEINVPSVLSNLCREKVSDITFNHNMKQANMNVISVNNSLHKEISS